MDGTFWIWDKRSRHSGVDKVVEELQVLQQSRVCQTLFGWVVYVLSESVESWVQKYTKNTVTSGGCIFIYEEFKMGPSQFLS